MTERPKMIFHVAYRLNPEARSASGIRPLQMRRAFEQIGFDVIEVSGRHAERKERIREVRKLIAEGTKFQFIYSESSTAPIGLGEPVTLAASLTRDTSFLKYCQQHGIPGAVFYRDIYWRFPIYAEVVRWPVSMVLRALYRWDLRRYKEAGVDVYLPSLAMAEWVPTIPPERFRELPPGAEIYSYPNREDASKIRIFYVGGLGSNYRLHETVRELAGRDDVNLTICTREDEWLLREPEYRNLLAPNIQIVHASGAELDGLYAESDICLLTVEPIDYWKFAVPLKMLEYLGRGKPMIASKGTYAAHFVQEQAIGWVVRYGTNELPALLDRLVTEPELIEQIRKQVREVAPNHTWQARARQVVEDLTGKTVRALTSGV